MNKYVERLYNGTDQRKSYLCPDAWYVSDTCCYIFSNQRTWHGTFYN